MYNSAYYEAPMCIGDLGACFPRNILHDEVASDDSFD